MAEFYKTLKVRVKDKHAPQLSRMARSVNYVWNYCNELAETHTRRTGKFLSGYDFWPYLRGANKELGLHSHTMRDVAIEYANKRFQHRKLRLAWRKSYGSRRSHGWIPLPNKGLLWKNGQLYHFGTYFSVWDSYGLKDYEFRSGSFNEDARGRWYLNITVKVVPEESYATASVGLDLGCKDTVTDSNGEGVHGHEYKKLEAKLGLAQRARNKGRVKAIHAKIANRRKDALHKYSRKLVNENAAIFVGNVSSQAMIKTKLAKSVHDAGWGMLKTLLEYKCAHADTVFMSVNEAYSTQACSSCGSISSSSPKGRAGLGIREWTCSECGAEHHRDINAAKNILAAGHCRLAEEMSL